MQQALIEFEEEKDKHTQNFQKTAEHSLTELKAIQHTQETILEDTKTEIGHIVAAHLQDERNKLEKEIQEREEKRPARKAAETAITYVTDLEKRIRTYKRIKNGLIAFEAVIILTLIIFLFFPPPQWIAILLLVVTASIFIALVFWRILFSEDKLAEDKRQIALYQTKSNEYAALTEEERCTLLIQKNNVKCSLFLTMKEPAICYPGADNLGRSTGGWNEISNWPSRLSKTVLLCLIMIKHKSAWRESLQPGASP